MIAREIRSFAAAGAAILALSLAGAGCGEMVAPEVDQADLAEQNWSDKGKCPNGWSDPDVDQMVCAEGKAPTSKDFGGNLCVRCKPEPTTCSGPWLPASVMVKCLPGSTIVYSDDGACKRCDTPDECTTDADCMRTGCSGQVCSNESVITTCEFRPEYACYAEDFASCGCSNGSCGWDLNAALLECLAEASAP